MAPLGPFEPHPRLAVAVSGGADSLALVLLADLWARPLGGAVLGLIVDHGLRAESAREAKDARAKLAARSIEARVLPAAGLRHGSAMAARARAARYSLLRDACAEAGIVHLLLAQHAADQAETVIMRALSASGPSGLAGMAALIEEAGLRLLRPLLGMPPSRLRATLRAAGLGWAEDPSNADRSALRPRLRALRADRAGTGPATAALAAAARATGRRRAVVEADAADFLAGHVMLRPEGFALLPAMPMPATALQALIATVGGSARPLSGAALRTLAAAPRPTTLAGVRLLAAGRLGSGLLAVREAVAMAPAVPARPGVLWDGRFRLADGASPPTGAVMGALGAAAAALRGASDLPSAVLRTLPALWDDGRLLAVPHLSWPNPATCALLPVLFAPARPAGAAPFVPAGVAA